ncbi:hypothetical protein [Sporomusa carbonis]|uniref:hypothetical protein n=1 Tax=Sporomusa carbonis TaxID=3076075 RepID=UPI003C7E5713
MSIAKHMPTTTEKAFLARSVASNTNFLYQAFSELVAALSREPARTSRGRRSYKDGYELLLGAINELGTGFLDTVDEGMYL